MAVRRCVPDFEGRLIAGRTTLPVEVGVHDLDILQWLVDHNPNTGGWRWLVTFGVPLAVLHALVGDGLDAPVFALTQFVNNKLGATDPIPVPNPPPPSSPPPTECP